MVRRAGLWLALVACALITLSASAQEDEVSELVARNSSFAFDVYTAVTQNTVGNVEFSPYSVSQALAMTYAGADGQTAAQMADALSFALEPPALHEAFSALNADLVERGNAEDDPANYQTARALRIANALWGEQTYPFSSDYDSLIGRYYGAGVQQTDFANAPEDARQQINDWVAEQTEDRIQNIVPEGAISPITRLVLANAIYFYGGWQSPFISNNTQDGDFHLLDDSTVTVPFMFQRVRLPYARGDGFQMVEFPYAGSGLTFTVIMPDEGQFETFESGLDSDALNSALTQLAYTDVAVYLPKFEFDYGTSLAGTLSELGMSDAFDPAHADFTGMIAGTTPAALFISDVLHKAFISVDENGTEAAAATVVMMAQGLAVEQPEPIEVRIDHRFIFAIRDTQTGTLLFLGRVMNPAG